MKRIVLGLLLGAFAVGDVAIDDDEFSHVAFRIADGAGDRFQDAPGTVFVADAVVELPSDAGAASFAGRFQHFETIVGVDLIEGRSFSELRGGVAEDAFVGGAVVEAIALHVDQRDHVGGIFGHNLE